MTSGRPKHLESIISLCLLGVIVLIAVGVLIKQSDYEMSQFGMDAAVKVAGENDSGINIKKTLNDLKTPGLKKLSDTEVYDSQNLYEKINGKAPTYLESGFRQLTTQRFASKKNPNLWSELYVYDMGSELNAYSVYSRQKRAGATELS